MTSVLKPGDRYPLVNNMVLEFSGSFPLSRNHLVRKELLPVNTNVQITFVPYRYLKNVFGIHGRLITSQEKKTLPRVTYCR